MTEQHTYPNARRLTEAQERMIWAQEIQPILTKHFNSALRYKWFPEPAVITSDDLVAVWVKLLWHLLDAEEGGDLRWTEFEAYTPEIYYDPDEFLPGVMMFLKAGMPDTERGVPIGDLKTLFFSYLRTVVDDGSLPVFLAFIDHERGGDVCETEQTGTSHEAPPLPIAADKNKWSFTWKGGPTWDVTFDGEDERVMDRIPVRRMLHVLEQPGVRFGYIHLVRSISKSKTEPAGASRRCSIVAKEEGLSDQENYKEKVTKREIDTMKEVLHLQYKTYLENQENERDKWLKLKRFAEAKYPLMVKETDDGLKVIRSKFKKDSNPDIEKAMKAISRDRITFFNEIKHVQGLYEHMRRYLKIDNGIIYKPPKDSPHWQIIQQNKNEVC